MLVLSGIGIFFSALLLIYNKGYKSANIYLGLFLFSFNFVTLSHYLYIFNQSKAVLAFILSIPINASAYVIGPLAFLYVRSILRDNAKFTKYDGLHFIVFAIIFLGRLPHNLASWEEKSKVAEVIIGHSWKYLAQSNLINFIPLRINYALKGLHLLLYLIAIWGLIVTNKYKKSSNLVWGNQQKIVKNWLYFFAIIVTFSCVFLSSITLIFLNLENKITFQYEGNILFALVFIGFLLLILGLVLFPQILYGIPMEKPALEDKEDKVLPESETESFSLQDDYILKIKLLLEDWKKGNKFLDIDSSTYSLAKEINLPIHHITYFINQINNEKYIDWRNRLRVEFAINLINNQKGYNKTIEVLGKECGFGSYPAFIQSFKQITGKLPKDYIKDSKQTFIP
ncbi:MAG: helix-turn-helix domain-containing protein [Bacteroidota bacterium]